MTEVAEFSCLEGQAPPSYDFLKLFSLFVFRNLEVFPPLLETYW